MDVSLKDHEIKEALELYINNQGISTEGKTVSINLKSGRKGNGHSAEIVISAGIDPKTVDSTADTKDADSIFGGKSGEDS